MDSLRGCMNVLLLALGYRVSNSEQFWSGSKIIFQDWILLFDPCPKRLNWSKIVLVLQKDKALTLSNFDLLNFYIIIICLNCCSFADISSSTSSQKFLEFQSIKMKLVSKDHTPPCHIFAFNRRWKCENSFPNSLWSISYWGVIWELSVLSLKYNFFW